MKPEPERQRADLPACCPLYHEAVELIGRRWTGAIVEVLMQADTPLRFSQIAEAVPELSDRLLSERVKELEMRGVVVRRVDGDRPVRVDYALTPMGRSLEPAVAEIKAWAQQWLVAESAAQAAAAASSPGLQAP